MAQSRTNGGRRAGFTVLRNPVLQNPALSLKAKGLYAYMRSLPEDWNYSVSGLAVQLGVGRDTVRGALKELVQAGYLTWEQGHGSQGQFTGAVYLLHDEPQGTAGCAPSDSPAADFPAAEEPAAENPAQQKKEKQNHQRQENPIAPGGGGRDAAPGEVRAVLDGYIGGDRALARAVDDYLEMRRRKHRPVSTVRAARQLCRKLSQYSAGDREKKIAILDRSTERCWTGVFALEGGQSAGAAARPPGRRTPVGAGWD